MKAEWTMTSFNLVFCFVQVDQILINSFKFELEYICYTCSSWHFLYIYIHQKFLYAVVMLLIIYLVSNLSAR